MKKAHPLLILGTGVSLVIGAIIQVTWLLFMAVLGLMLIVSIEGKGKGK